MRLSMLCSLLIVVVLSATRFLRNLHSRCHPQPVPRLINITGSSARPTVSQPAPSRPSRCRSTPTQRAARPLWQETQTVALDDRGRYSLLLGAAHADGIPAAVFGSGDASGWAPCSSAPAKSKGRASG